MTYIYQWFSFPEIFSVICPKCNKECNCTETKITKITNGIKAVYKTENKIFVGKLNCIHCGYNSEKNIQWDKDAYWKFNIKGKLLWAWSLEHTKAILEYISSKNRKQLNGKYASSLLHIQKHFKLAKNRNEVIRKIIKRINEKE